MVVAGKRRIPLWQRLFNIRHHVQTHTARLRRRISDELFGRAHSHRAADPTDVLESSIIFGGKHSHPGIYRMSQSIEAVPCQAPKSLIYVGEKNGRKIWAIPEL
jgi:hypothetical protein